MARKKKYYLMKRGSKVSVFTGRSPRQAALKAAARGYSDIRLRERGRRNKDKTYTIHVFNGNVKTVDAPEKRPAWLPARIKKAFVRKKGIDKINKI
ncbi:MAG: non-histone chromosomal MC1 family protein [Candidatus Aenigmarchaeota archaeon]